ncbi:MAG: hypothetical protein NTU83_07420 [Candidatus Hydrogenedentes bacterium]|nr:hypothetical protein [Candidatus Hydrogenedentota bacterium]
MKNAGLYLGWVVAIAAIAGVAVLFVSARRQSNEAEELRLQTDSLKKQVTALRTVVSEKDAALEDLQTKLDERKDKTAESPAADTVPPKSGMAPLLGKMMASMMSPGGDEKDKAKGADGKQGNPLAAISQMFAGENGKQLARQSAAMSVNMQYGGLFDKLHLSSEAEEHVRQIFADNAADQMTSAMDMMQGKSSPETLKQARDDSKAKLRADLAAVLSPEAMATYDEYETEMPKRMLAQSLDMQLNMFAPALGADTRIRVRDVLQEEMLPLAEEQHNAATGIPSNLQSYMDEQREVYARARDRLAQELDETQMVQVDRFISQAQQMSDASVQMMRNMFPESEKPK